MGHHHECRAALASQLQHQLEDDIGGAAVQVLDISGLNVTVSALATAGVSAAAMAFSVPIFSAVSPGTYVIPVKLVGTDLAALANKAVAFTQRQDWKVTSFDYLVAGTSAPSVGLSLLVGEGGSAMTGASSVTLGATTRISVPVTAGNTGTASQAIVASFGSVSGTMTLLDMNILCQRN